MSIWLMMRRGESRCLAPWTQHPGDLKMTASPQRPGFTVVISPRLVDSCQLLRIQLWLALGNSFPFPTRGCLDRKPIPVAWRRTQNVGGWAKCLSSVRCFVTSLKLTWAVAQIQWQGFLWESTKVVGLGWSTLSAGRCGGVRVIWVKDEACVILGKTSWWPLRMLIS